MRADFLGGDFAKHEASALHCVAFEKKLSQCRAFILKAYMECLLFIVVVLSIEGGAGEEDSGHS